MNKPTISKSPAAAKSFAFDWKTGTALFTTVLLWGSAFAGIRAGLRSYSPEGVALLRYLTASASLLVYALAVRLPLPKSRDLPLIALTGFLGFSFYNVALNAGEEHIPAGTASLLIASAPIFVAMLAVGFQKEQLHGRGWAGIGISFVGAAVIAFQSGEALHFSSGALLVLAAAAAQAAYTILQKPLLKRINPLHFATYAIWAGSLFLLIYLPKLWGELGTAVPEATWAVIYMGLFPGAVGYISWSFALARLPASRAGSFLYLVPAAAILIAWLWLGELPSTGAILGGSLVMTGVLLVNWRQR